VLGVVVTERIFRRYPHMPEGELAKLRSSVVSAASLAEVGADLDVGSAMRLGKGEEASGGRSKPSILADAVEALIGAVFLDGGLEAGRSVVLGLLDEQITANADDGPGQSDFKTQLQELAARLFEQLPSYEVRDEGPDHQKRFFAAVRVDGTVRGEGEGRTKKQAEQAAARDACERLRAEGAERTKRTESDPAPAVAVLADGGDPADDTPLVAVVGADGGAGAAPTPQPAPERGVGDA